MIETKKFRLVRDGDGDTILQCPDDGCLWKLIVLDTRDDHVDLDYLTGIAEAHRRFHEKRAATSHASA